MEYELDARCANCGYTFGEHCTADDACPMYLGRVGGSKRHGGFNRASKFSTTANNNPKGKGETLADAYEAAEAALREAKREVAAAEETLKSTVEAMIDYLEKNIIAKTLDK